MPLLENKKAIITGASRGIGRDIALAYATAGADLVLNASKDSSGLRETASAVRELGRECIIVIGSVSEKQTGEDLVDAAIERWSRLDILVNNAGITQDKLLMFMSDKEWDEVIDVNLKGVFQCSRMAIRPMMQQRSGRIITVSSISAISGRPGQVNYASAKAGVMGFTKSLAREIGKFDVLVNALLVGVIDTQMTKKMPQKQAAMLKSTIPLERIGRPEEVAGPCVFLGSDMASYVTGTTINVSGGAYI